MFEWRKSRAWRRVRRIWIGLGVAAVIYLFLSFAAWGVDEQVLISSGQVEVSNDSELMSFVPRGRELESGVVFIPGGLVDPEAYAPLLRSIADAGYPSILVKLPSLAGRHALGQGGRNEVVSRVLSVLEQSPGESLWLVAGHSLGGAIASMVAQRRPPRMGGLALLATTHPRDFTLGNLSVPVVKIYGTRDGIAPLERMRINEDRVPQSTKWLGIEGGNHSQFGYYGFQVGDRRAEISRADQQDQILAALLDAIPK